jgi:glycosyltransferase involved in cell wall biosynthesis
VKHEDVLAAIKQAKLMTLPSLAYEGPPTTIIEGLACGMHIVVPDIEALAKMSRSGRSAIMFSPGDSDVLVWLVDGPWMDENRLRQLGPQGRQDHDRSYTSARDHEQPLEVYKSVAL